LVMERLECVKKWFFPTFGDGLYRIICR